MIRLLLLLLLLPSCTESVYAQAVWGNRTYNAPVCNKPNCAMCQSIREQLWQQKQVSINGISTNSKTLSGSQTTNQIQNHLPAYSQHYQAVQVPYTVRVKRCNGKTCWYENITQYRTEYQPTQPTALTHNTQLVPTPPEAVVELLRIANPKPYEVLYDIGCGDGRILIAATTAFGCRSVGIELNPESAKQAKESIAEFNLNNIRVYEGDALNFTYPHADVVTMYLYPELMEKLLPKFRSGTRVISYLHSIPNSIEHKVGEHTFYEWIKP